MPMADFLTDIFDNFVSCLIFEVAIEIHRVAKTRGLAIVSHSVSPRERSSENKPVAVENKPATVPIDSIAARGIICSCCGQRVYFSKYAPHLEKCMFGHARLSNLRNSQSEIGAKKRRKN